MCLWAVVVAIVIYKIVTTVRVNRVLAWFPLTLVPKGTMEAVRTPFLNAKDNSEN